MTSFNDNWSNSKTKNFINKLSFDGYILAGNSVANMIEGIPLQGDLDFWVEKGKDFYKAFDEMYLYYDKFNIYPSMIEMLSNDDEMPKINLIYTEFTPEQTIKRFDWDYCRCYYTPETGIKKSKICEDSIKNKFIIDPKNYFPNRIFKAVKYGYKFSPAFWEYNSYMIKNKEILEEVRCYRFSEKKPYDMKIENLDETKYKYKEIELKITDVNDVEMTLKNLCEQYQKIISESDYSNYKLPVLVSLNKDNKELIVKYIKNIIMNNPLESTNYMEFKIGSKFVTRDKNKYILRKDAEEEKILNDKYSDNDEIIVKKQSPKIVKKIIDEKELHKEELDDRCSDFDDKYLEYPDDVIKKIQSPKIIKKIAVKNDFTFISSDNTSRVIQLNESGTSYLTISYLPSELSNLKFDTFCDMWKLHPKEKHKIIMYEKEVEVNRYSQSYLHTPNDLSHTTKCSYMYSGYDTSNNNKDLPSEFKPYYEHMLKKDNKYNQVIANWYEDGNDYIAPHSDCQKNMINDYIISILSLYPKKDEKDYRYLELTPKNHTITKYNSFKIRMDHGMIISMCGNTQDEFRHGIKKVTYDVMPRISLSFRQMKT